jgi:hypothetical protein
LGERHGSVEKSEERSLLGDEERSLFFVSRPLYFGMDTGLEPAANFRCEAHRGLLQKQSGGLEFRSGAVVEVIKKGSYSERLSAFRQEHPVRDGERMVRRITEAGRDSKKMAQGAAVRGGWT